MIKVINIDLYDSTVFVLSGATEKEFDKWVKPWQKDAWLDDYDIRMVKRWLKDPKQGEGFTHTLDYLNYLVFIRDEKDWNTIAHELMHATNRILRDRGIKISKEAEEYAYLNGYLHERYHKTK